MKRRRMKELQLKTPAPTMRIDDRGEDADVDRDGMMCEELGSGLSELSELLIGLGMSFRCFNCPFVYLHAHFLLADYCGCRIQIFIQ